MEFGAPTQQPQTPIKRDVFPLNLQPKTTKRPRLRVYNTLSREKEPFRTVQPGKVGIYLCGPTVYDKAHIGHMVGPVIFDCIKRYLTYCGYDVTWVVNITDVDDKLIKKANERGISMLDVAEENIADYNGNLAALGVDQIDHFPAGDRLHARDHRVHRGADRTRFRLRVGRRRLFRRRQGPAVRQALEPQRRVDARRGGRDGSPQTARGRLRPLEIGQARASRRGTAPGARAGPAGTSSARR